ncbi:MAG TPA: heavy metal-associated domain-containing protein [Bacteroidota bacterium]|jgi:copper chaperone CopZ|nr:heavy metal-associated domain-containing protein [Bacteroidota bacterium]
MENNKLLILKVNGMTCKHCELTIENTLKEIPNIYDVEADREKKMVKIYYQNDLDLEQIKTIIEENGFKVLE